MIAWNWLCLVSAPWRYGDTSTRAPSTRSTLAYVTSARMPMKSYLASLPRHAFLVGCHPNVSPQCVVWQSSSSLDSCMHLKRLNHLLSFDLLVVLRTAPQIVP
jgi:hypothetical protein